MHDVVPPRRPGNGSLRPVARPLVVTGRQAPEASEPTPPPAAPTPEPHLESLNLNETPLLPPPQKPKRHRGWLVAIAAVLLVILASCAAGYFWYQDALQAPGTSTSPQRVQVAKGDTWDSVGLTLQEKGVIKNSLALSIYLRLHGIDALQTGAYSFSANQPLAEVVEWLASGKTNVQKVTILPGKTLPELTQGLVKAGYQEEAVAAALAKKYDHPLLKDKPAEASLEGYIYPETFFMTSGSPVEELFTRSFDEFEKQLTQKQLRPGLAARGWTLHQGIIMASLVDGEVPLFDDKRQVAQVFETRFKKEMTLGSDVSYKYAAKMLGVEPSPDIESPYNTRKYAGLPPGPVANFNLPALEAVANPAAGDFLYFVSGDDGTTHFSHTFAEHEENIRKYCHELCFSN